MYFKDDKKRHLFVAALTVWEPVLRRMNDTNLHIEVNPVRTLRIDLPKKIGSFIELAASGEAADKGIQVTADELRFIAKDVCQTGVLNSDSQTLRKIARERLKSMDMWTEVSRRFLP
jgi:hypothetical protein